MPPSAPPPICKSRRISFRLKLCSSDVRVGAAFLQPPLSVLGPGRGSRPGPARSSPAPPTCRLRLSGRITGVEASSSAGFGNEVLKSRRRPAVTSSSSSRRVDRFSKLPHRLQVLLHWHNIKIVLPTTENCFSGTSASPAQLPRFAQTVMCGGGRS